MTQANSSRRLRIVYVIESLEFGGAEKVAVDLANEMATRHEVTICCVKRLGDLASDVDRRIRVLCLEKRDGNDLRLPFRLARIAACPRADVLHTHEWGVFLEGALAGALSRTPVLVHTVHGPYTAYAPGWRSRFKRSMRHALERIAARRFSALVTVSDSIQEYIGRDIRIDSRRVRTIHNGIRVDVSSGIPSRSARTTTFISVGRLARIKNHGMMIRALGACGDPRARLVLVGDGPERLSLEALARELGLGDRVSFLGFRRDVDRLLASSIAFLVSSDHEGISVAVLEAMRAGLPVIGTRVGGMPETVLDGKTGVLVPKGDVAAMARAMRRLLESSEQCARYGREGRQLQAAEFSIDRMVARYEQIYAGA